MDLREVENVNPWTHWYYLTKALAVSNLLGHDTQNIKKVIDVGAGSAFFSEYLSECLLETTFECVDPNYEFEEQDLSARIRLTRKLSHSDGDLYLFMDVLEHVKDDKALLESYLAGTKIGTKVLITVPAFNFLWSEHDVYLGHFRRYRKKEVKELAVSTGLRIEKSYYLFSTLLPFVFILRKLGYRRRQGSNMTELPFILNWLLTRIHMFEHKFLKNPLFGLSVVLVAVKTS